MAEIVNELPFGWHKTNNNYPWEQWLDGQAWRLVQGEDFTDSARTMQRLAYGAGRRVEGVSRVHTKNRVEGTDEAPQLVLYVQAERSAS